VLATRRKNMEKHKSVVLILSFCKLPGLICASTIHKHGQGTKVQQSAVVGILCWLCVKASQELRTQTDSCFRSWAEIYPTFFFRVRYPHCVEYKLNYNIKKYIYIYNIVIHNFIFYWIILDCNANIYFNWICKL